MKERRDRRGRACEGDFGAGSTAVPTSILQALTQIFSSCNVGGVAVTAKSLILDLLSTLRGGSMPVRALVAAGDIFGLEENGMRVALARLLAAGLVERDERGQYRPGSRAEALQREVTSWRTVEDGLRRWQAEWVGVHVGALPRGPRARVARTRALRLLGFRELVPGLEIRPDNLAGGV